MRPRHAFFKCIKRSFSVVIGFVKMLRIDTAMGRAPNNSNF